MCGLGLIDSIHLAYQFCLNVEINLVYEQKKSLINFDWSFYEFNLGEWNE